MTYYSIISYSINKDNIRGARSKRLVKGRIYDILYRYFMESLKKTTGYRG